MSFGWSPGDLVLAIKLSNDIHDALTKSTEEYEHFARWLEKLTAILQLFHNHYSITGQQSFGTSSTDEELLQHQQQQELVKDLKVHVDQLLATLQKYLLLEKKDENISVVDWCIRQGRKLQWKFLDREDVIQQQNEVSHHLGMLDAVISAQTRRDISVAFPAVFERMDANHRSEMNLVADTNRKGDQMYDVLMNLTHLLTNFILASGKIPNSQPLANAASSNVTNKAKLALQLLQRQVPITSMKPIDAVDKTLKIGFSTRDVLERWLAPEAKQSCLWIQDDNAKQFSQEFVAIQYQMQLPVIFHHCERKDADGTFLEPGQILHRLGCSFLHQLLYYMVCYQLPMPATLDLNVYRDFDFQNPDSCSAILGLVGDLLDDSIRLIWIIDGFERLEDKLLQDSEQHKRALDKLLNLVGATKVPPSAQTKARGRRSMITTTLKSRSLKERSLKGDIKLFMPAERADPERYTLADSLRSMLLGWKRQP